MTNSVQAIDIQGIKYYPDFSSCIASFEKKKWGEKAISFIRSFGTWFQYGMARASLIIKNSQKKMNIYANMPTSNSTANKLIVCLHGLNASSLQFKKIVDKIEQKNGNQSAIYIPAIKDKGNAKLDEIIKPILQNIGDWAKTGKDKELVLVGISNGARIARAIETELINSGKTGEIKRLRFISIAGACKGSSLVSVAKKLHVAWILSKNIRDEMDMNSDRFKRLEKDWNQASIVKNLEREYTFFASPHDWQVPDYSSTLMAINYNAKKKYAIIPTHGHNSIVNAVAKSVADIIINY